MIFWKLRKRPFKWCVLIQNFVGALICPFSASDHGLLSMVSPNRQLLLSLEYELWWHNLKGLFLSFQKIITFFDIGSTEFKLWQLSIKHGREFYCSTSTPHTHTHTHAHAHTPTPTHTQTEWTGTERVHLVPSSLVSRHLHSLSLWPP